MRSLLFAGLMALSSVAAADTAFGRLANPGEADLVIKLIVTDEMRFIPASIRVKRGDIVRFIVTNDGRLPHEMVLGTMDDLKKHRARHDPNELELAPGKTRELDWQFTDIGEFYYGSPTSGEPQADTIGTVLVY